MELFSHFLHNAFAFIVILTAIVFVHEFGHYLVAKIAGVKVEAFSIGFGKEIFGLTDQSGTRWKISILPLGGYVKMFGDIGPSSTPDTKKIKEFTPEEKKIAFHTKPLLAKAAIVSAGPIANFILAIVILTFTYYVHGKPISIPEVGEVQPGSPAAIAGIMEGDLIIAIDGEATQDVEDIDEVVSINTGTAINIKLKRNNQILETKITPKIEEHKSIFGDKAKLPTLGIQYSALVIPEVSQVMPGSAAAQVGIKNGDIITQIDLKQINSFADIQKAVKNSKGEPLNISFLRSEPVEVKLTPQMGTRVNHDGSNQKIPLIGVRTKVSPKANSVPENIPPLIMDVVKDSPSDKAGIKVGDLIESINGHKTKTFVDVQNLISKNLNKEITIKLLRKNQMSAIIVPKIEKIKDDSGAEKSVPLIGIRSIELPRNPIGFISSFAEANKQIYRMCKLTLKAIGQIITGHRDASEISGPIGIAKYSGYSFSIGLDMVLWFMTILSVNLGLVNLFPIPTLDGGHLLYYLIEMLRGKPLADKYQNIGFKIGITLIVALAIFAIINDIRKL